ncbi:hypothetical protein HDV00_004540 [Rhizophlyctis rosea]|nr:hypothetical protein HDV00_004540 [Rhizophlyctis rosea]
MLDIPWSPSAVDKSADSSGPMSLTAFLDASNAPGIILNTPSLQPGKPSISIRYTNAAYWKLIQKTHAPKTSTHSGLTVKDVETFRSWLASVGPASPATSLATTVANHSVEWTATKMSSDCYVLTAASVRALDTPDCPFPSPAPSTPSTTENIMDAATATANDSWKLIPRVADSVSGGGVMGEILRYDRAKTVYACFRTRLNPDFAKNSNHDWSNTVLGPISSWPQSLLTAVSLTMASAFPMAVWWGSEFTLIYNDAYMPICGAKHPYIFGKPGYVAWSEIWHELEPSANRVMQGETCYSEDHLLFMLRNGFPEETYHTWSYVPIRKEDGSVGGLLNPTYMSTGRVVADRRMATLRDYAALTSTAKAAKEVCAAAGTVMEANGADIVFAALYTITVDHAGNATTPMTPEPSPEAVPADSKLYRLKLMEAVGVKRGSQGAPDSVVVDPGSGPDARQPWPFHEVCVGKKMVEINDQKVVGGIKGRGWDDAPRLTVAVPIIANNAENVMGVMIVGISARRPFDDDYRSFIELLARQTANSLAAVKAFEEGVQRAEALAAIDRAKTAFFSSVSHELRTPLTLILSPVDDLLEDPHLKKNQLERVQLIKRNSQRLLKLVNSLLDFTRIEAGRMQASFRESDLGILTAELASVFRSAIEKGGVSYFVDCEHGGRTVWVDRDMWEKVVFNMIGNAFKYTLEGTIEVSVRPAEDGSGVTFAVQDTGTGIPSHQIERIFDRFHRVEGQKGRSHEGTGIGLALTNELVKLHGGIVKVDSEFGKGSTFAVTIPYGTAHLPQDRLVDSADDVGSVILDPRASSYGRAMVEEAKQWIDEGTEESSTADSTDSSVPSNSVPMSTRGSKILLADDNADIRRYLKTLLSKWWEVTDVSDGQQALDAIMKTKPDIVVSDVMMPILDGFGLLKVIRSLPETKLLPVILLSARAGEEARVDGLQLGADDYLVKPFSAKELVARIHTHLELGKLRKELESMVVERTKELAESEWRYKVLASMSPVGIFRAGKAGQLTFTNQKWWEISMHDRVKDPTGSDFFDAIHPEDQARCRLIWQEAFEKEQGVYIEFRWKNALSGQERWVLAQTIVEYDADKKFMGHIGTLTDMTERKKLEAERLRALELAEKYQRKRAEEAEEIKKQQELFIDMTCHELRNPLNGIYHNADLLHESLKEVQKEVTALDRTVEITPWEDSAPVQRKEEQKIAVSVKKVTSWLGQEVISDLEAVETISLCAQHQKKIADDVLHMSKLSMNLLVLASVDFQPVVEIRKVLRMFETEAKSKRIDMKFIIADSFNNIDWVRGDPTRLGQVMLNLLTNALRFTERAEVRKVTVTMEAKDAPPFAPKPDKSNDTDEAWDDERGDRRNHVMTMERSPSLSSTSSGGTAKAERLASTPNFVYVQISICDSGLGMTAEEQAMLFRRFTQASPKTYAEFGGSGLGLFISKRIVELHNGHIAVDSTKGKGTTFTFFMKYELPEREGGLGLEGGISRPATPPAAAVESAEKSDAVPSMEAVTEVHTQSLVSIRPAEVPVVSVSAPTSVSPETDGVSNKIKVLVVEDNLINQKVLKRQLEQLGYEVRVANHGAEAIDVLLQTDSSEAEKAFGVVLMDIEMPVMDGLQATMQIRHMEAEGKFPRRRTRLPIVAVTGNARKEQLEKAINAGMDDAMVKPYVKKDLIEKIEKYGGGNLKA